MTRYFFLTGNAIRTLHYRYGKGDIQEIRQFVDGRIEVESCCYSDKPHVRRGHVIQKPGNRRTIYLYGHQMTVRIV